LIRTSVTDPVADPGKLSSHVIGEADAPDQTIDPVPICVAADTTEKFATEKAPRAIAAKTFCVCVFVITYISYKNKIFARKESALSSYYYNSTYFYFVSKKTIFSSF